MSVSLCFYCGADKTDAFGVCNECASTPRTDEERQLSLVLSGQLSSFKQLASYRYKIRSNLPLSIPVEILAFARNILKDPKLNVMLEPHLAQQAIESESPPQKAKAITSLHKSPFIVLGVTIHDNRKRIIEIAEDKLLELDHGIIQSARSDLTTPRIRLAAEIAWLPGISPEQVTHLLERLYQDPFAFRDHTDLPKLAHLNLLSAAFEILDSAQDADDFVSFILEVAYLVDDLESEDVLRTINNDRVISGFPQVKAIDLIESELVERKRTLLYTIKSALDKLPTVTLVWVVTAVVNRATEGGEFQAPELIDDLVDSYEIESQDFLKKEAENVHKLIEAASDAANSGETKVEPYLDKLEVVTRNWDKVAQPIQLSAKARGIAHKASSELAHHIRSFAVDLWNKNHLLEPSQRLVSLIQELFAELPEVLNIVEQDAEKLHEIDYEQKQATAFDSDWAKKITYRVDIGLIFKDTLSISPDGISWKGKSFTLDSITRVRWGGVSRTVNGVPSGTTYTVAFGDKHSEVVIELKRQEIYETFIEKLWMAVCIRLLTETLATLKNGNSIQFGKAILHDDGMTLVREKFWGSNEKVRCSWSKLQAWNSNGVFIVGTKDDAKVKVKLPYLEIENTHILEQIVRMAFKKPGMQRLSDLLPS